MNVLYTHQYRASDTLMHLNAMHKMELDYQMPAVHGMMKLLLRPHHLCSPQSLIESSYLIVYIVRFLIELLAAAKHPIDATI